MAFVVTKGSGVVGIIIDVYVILTTKMTTRTNFLAIITYYSCMHHCITGKMPYAHLSYKVDL